MFCFLPADAAGGESLQPAPAEQQPQGTVPAAAVEVDPAQKLSEPAGLLLRNAFSPGDGGRQPAAEAAQQRVRNGVPVVEGRIQIRFPSEQRGSSSTCQTLPLHKHRPPPPVFRKSFPDAAKLHCFGQRFVKTGEGEGGVPPAGPVQSGSEPLRQSAPLPEHPDGKLHLKRRQIPPELHAVPAERRLQSGFEQCTRKLPPVLIAGRFERRRIDHRQPEHFVRVALPHLRNQRGPAVEPPEAEIVLRNNHPFTPDGIGGEQGRTALPESGFRRHGVDHAPYAIDGERQLVARGIAVTAQRRPDGNAAGGEPGPAVDIGAAFQPGNQPGGETAIGFVNPAEFQRKAAVKRTILHAGSPSAGVGEVHADLLRRRQQREPFGGIRRGPVVVKKFRFRTVKILFENCPEGGSVEIHDSSPVSSGNYNENSFEKQYIITYFIWKISQLYLKNKHHAVNWGN